MTPYGRFLPIALQHSRTVQRLYLKGSERQKPTAAIGAQTFQDLLLVRLGLRIDIEIRRQLWRGSIRGSLLPLITWARIETMDSRLRKIGWLSSLYSEANPSTIRGLERSTSAPSQTYT